MIAVHCSHCGIEAQVVFDADALQERDYQIDVNVVVHSICTLCLVFSAVPLPVSSQLRTQLAFVLKKV